MTINVGMRKEARSRSNLALALTLSDEALDDARREWGPLDAVRLRWTLTAVMPGRYRLVFFPCQLGNVGLAQHPPSGGGKQYVTFKWGRKDELVTIIDMPSIRDKAVEYARWEGGTLVVEVRRDKTIGLPFVQSRETARRIADRQLEQLRQPRPAIENNFSASRARLPRTAKSKEKKSMQTEAIYEQKKTTSGSVCYAVVEGDLSLGVLYIRKDSPLLKGSAPKRLRVQITVA